MFNVSSNIGASLCFGFGKTVAQIRPIWEHSYARKRSEWNDVNVKGAVIFPVFKSCDGTVFFVMVKKTSVYSLKIIFTF